MIYCKFVPLVGIIIKPCTLLRKFSVYFIGLCISSFQGRWQAVKNLLTTENFDLRAVRAALAAWRSKRQNQRHRCMRKDHTVNVQSFNLFFEESWNVDRLPLKNTLRQYQGGKKSSVYRQGLFSGLLCEKKNGDDTMRELETQFIEMVQCIFFEATDHMN